LINLRPSITSLWPSRSDC